MGVIFTTYLLIYSSIYLLDLTFLYPLVEPLLLYDLFSYIHLLFVIYLFIYFTYFVIVCVYNFFSNLFMHLFIYFEDIDFMKNCSYIRKKIITFTPLYRHSTVIY